MALELEPLCSQRKRGFVARIQRRNVFCWLVRVLHGVKICTFGPGGTAACQGARNQDSGRARLPQSWVYGPPLGGAPIKPEPKSHLMACNFRRHRYMTDTWELLRTPPLPAGPPCSGSRLAANGRSFDRDGDRDDRRSPRWVGESDVHRSGNLNQFPKVLVSVLSGSGSYPPPPTGLIPLAGAGRAQTVGFDTH